MPKQSDGSPASEHETSEQRVSARFNSATAKGTVSLVAGLAILVVPTLSAQVLRLLLGGALILAGLSGSWFAGREWGTSRSRARTIAESVLMVGFGALLIFAPVATLRTVLLIGAVYLAIRGVAMLVSAFQAWRRQSPFTGEAVSALLYLGLAAVLLVLPEGVVREVVLVAAVSSVILGVIVLAYSSKQRSAQERSEINVASLSEMLNGWLRERDVGSERRKEIGDGLFFEEPDRSSKLASWWVMLLLSVAIATFGVIQDSTAVVIGAMLIAPLMTPILGTSAAIVNNWVPRIGSSAILVLAGAGAAIGLGFVIGQWFPIIVPLDQNSQVISRVTPNVIDMGIALVAGAAGAYANVDERVSDSIAGVAIAVALVPPLGVVGLTLQAGMFSDSLGALLLFLTNLVSIVLAAAVVFFLTGYAPYQRIRESRAEIAAFLRTVAVAALVIVIPLSLTAEDVLAGTARQGMANEQVADWLKGTSLAATRIEIDEATVDVLLIGPGEIPDLEALAADLSSEFGEPVALRVEHAQTTVVSTGTDG